MPHDKIGQRMKSFYEGRSQTNLTRRTPVIIRIDGKSFSRFCKRFEKPYDNFLHATLNNTLQHVCSKVQCVKMGQRHSDEMSLLLTDYETITTEPYFDYNVQKMCSIVAATATAEFCKQLAMDSFKPTDWGDDGEPISFSKRILEYDEDWPIFDARCFNIPENEISNYMWWRLLDAKRNSINMVSQSLFSHAELQNKTCDDMQEMMFQEKGINWNDLPQERKSGNVCIKREVMKLIEKGPGAGTECLRSIWSIEAAPKQKQDLDVIVNQVLAPPKI